MSQTELAIKLIDIARLRKELEEKVERVKQAKDQVEATGQWQVFGVAKVEHERIDLALTTAEDEARNLAIVIYQATLNKKPTDGIEIRLFPNLIYDLKEITEWAKTHAPDLLTLKLDTKIFEKVAEKLQAPVRVEEVPKAYIAKDLNGLLV